MKASRSISGPLLAQAESLVSQRMGLDFPESRWPDLERGLAAAGRDLGERDAEQFAARLVSEAPTIARLATVARHLTVGETYFFREKELLAAFRERILPALLRERAATTRALRIWSAGCSSGEEPYSIAMILEMVVPGLDSWDVQILGTDLNEASLEKARRGVYSQWSFRTTPDEIRDRFFRRRGDRKWELSPKVRARVRLAQLNLVGGVYPAGMDVIFCRNVLMYFSAGQRIAVIEELHRALAPGGWLIVSASETSDRIYEPFEPVRSERSTLYRKRHSSAAVPMPRQEAAGTAPMSAHGPAVQPAQRDRAARRARIAARTVAAPRPRAAEPAPPPPEPASVASARKLAGEGRLEEAAIACRTAIAAAKMDPVRHYLLAAIERELGNFEAAAQSLRRALYLDPDFVLAHFALANLEISRGHRGGAARHLRNALAAVRSHAGDETLPESDGLTASRFAEIVTSLLQTLTSGESNS